MGAAASFLPKRRGQETAQHQRFTINLRGQLVLMPREIEVEGMILNVSEGGCLFRPFQSHLINRTGDMIMVGVNGRRLPGRIMNTIPVGYGIAFPELVNLGIFGIKL